MAKTDPWLSIQQRNDATWVELDAALTAGYEAAVAEVLAKLWRIVLGERNAVTAATTPPDFAGAGLAARETWRQALARWVRPIAYAYYRRQYSEQPGDGQARTTDIDTWWATVVDRWMPTADNVVEAIRDEVRSRPTDGIPALRNRVARVLGLDSGSRKIRDEIAAVEAQLFAPGDTESLLARRVSLQAELFRVQASALRSRAYLALADSDPDNADNYRDLARQAARGEGDEQRIQRLLRQTDDQLFSGNEELSVTEESELRSRRRELYEQANEEDDTWRNTATRIARTTSTDVLNEATYQRAADVQREQGVELVKVWLAAKDERTRPTHKAAHGQTVELRAKFRVGDAELNRPGDPDGPLDEIIQCRCTTTYLTRTEHAEIAAVLASAIMGDEMDDEPLDALPPLMWHGVIAKEGVFTGDRRKFESGALRTQAFPFPMRFQREDWGGHSGAVVTANAEAARRYEGDIRAWGTFADASLTPEVAEVVGLFATGMMRGVSIDGDDVLDSQFEIEMDDDENVYEIFTSMRLRAATFVAIPAFDGAEIYLGPPPPEWLLEGEALAEQQNDAETHPVDLDELLASVSRIPEALVKYWLGPEGSSRVGGWGSPGSYTKCTAQLGEYVSPGQVQGACATLYHRATGEWPGRSKAAGGVLIASAESQFTIADFARIELPGPTALTIDETGKVYGHVAAWGTCHTGFSDMCVLPPRSKTDYTLFHTGAVRLADGNDLPIGKLTVGAGHANGKAGVRAATEHYDNSAMAVAVVRAYEDQFGIQVVGQIIPGTPQERIDELRRSPLSGDWRAYQGNLELIAALGVNTPGFPVPRTMVAAIEGNQVSLVAAGIIVRPDADVRSEVEELAASIGLDPKTRAAMIAASVPALGGR